ncbi:hypothetical protein [Turicibacter sanguinis]|uniref:hypothetical protein n=1 Tax=Turicibacter sanguinis TaxID=154288 RepID=UPI002942D1E0|nr:hypothetical protein [Turicibacter sanguinis]
MSNLSKDWFPEIDCDVFLSHSHKDDKLVTGIVGFFHECFNIQVFVDSYVWRYCNDLLKQLDDKYCRNQNLYDYDKRNYSTSHVHMMLATSLNAMINKAECIIFLETENSLDVQHIIENGTSSPWIYYELIATKLTQLTFPKRIAPEKRSDYEAFFSETFQPMYRGDVSHLDDLTSYCLEYVMQKEYQDKDKYLDEIYQNHSKMC